MKNKYLTEDFELKCDTIRLLLDTTWNNYQMAVEIAKEAGMIQPNVSIEEKQVKLSVFSYDKLIELMKDYFQVDFTINTRKRNVVDARHIVYYMLKKYTGLSLLQIGMLVGGRDHTTVIHGIAKVRDLLFSSDIQIVTYVDELSELIESRFKTIEQAAA